MRLRTLRDDQVEARVNKLWARLRRTVEQLEELRRERVRRDKRDAAMPPGLLAMKREDGGAAGKRPEEL